MRQNLLQANYLSKNNKKQLTNKVTCFVLRVMNANEIPPQANPRLGRIKTVSKVLRNILFAGLILQAVGILALLIVVLTAAWTKLTAQVVFEACSGLAALPFAFKVILSFFRFFDRLKDGQLFNSQTVKHLETAGKWWIGLGIIQILVGLFKAFIFSPDNLIVSGDAIVAGLAVFFIAWIFREAQKLQEEQELTV